MNKQQVIRAMAAAEIQGRVMGRGDDWEVGVSDVFSRDTFLAKVAAVGVTQTAWGWSLKPMKQAGLAFGTLDSAEQGSLFR